MSKLHEAKHHVNVKLDMDELDLTSAESKATYEEIKAYVAEHNDDMKVLSPTEKWGTKTEYARLRKFLLKDGYIRIGPEVFMRVVQNRKASEKHYRRIDEVKPKTGVVRLLRLTEKQYNNIYMVTGEPDYQEKTVGVNCHIMI